MTSTQPRTVLREFCVDADAGAASAGEGGGVLGHWSIDGVKEGECDEDDCEDSDRDSTEHSWAKGL